MEFVVNRTYLVEYKDFSAGRVHEVTIKRISPNGQFVELEMWDNDNSTRWERINALTILDQMEF